MGSTPYKGFTKARKNANAKYKEDKVESIQIYVQKGQKEKIKEAAREQGMSMNQFINQAVQKAMEDKGR